MARLTAHKQILAWLLLSIFTMLIGSSALHHHEHEENEFECLACQHHQHNTYHLTEVDSSLADCPLCQLAGVSYVAPVEVTLSFFLSSAQPVAVPYKGSLSTERAGLLKARAPPVL